MTVSYWARRPQPKVSQTLHEHLNFSFSLNIYRLNYLICIHRHTNWHGFSCCASLSIHNMIFASNSEVWELGRSYSWLIRNKFEVFGIGLPVLILNYCQSIFLPFDVDNRYFIVCYTSNCTFWNVGILHVLSIYKKFLNIYTFYMLFQGTLSRWENGS